MSDQPNEPTVSRSITFHRTTSNGSSYIEAIATTRTERPEAPVELIRPYSDGSGNEVLVSLSADEWAELMVFVEEHGKVTLIEAKS